MKKEDIAKLVKEEIDNMFASKEEVGLTDQNIVDFFREHESPTDSDVHLFAQESGIEKDEMEEKIYNILSDLVNKKRAPSPEVDVGEKKGEISVGGKGDNRPDEDFDPEQLRKGIKVESEHTNDPKLAKEIAKDHLVEDPEYYDKLEKMEGGFEQMSDSKNDKELQEEIPAKRRSKPTQKIDPMDIEKIRGGKSDDFKKSNLVPLAQVKLMIAQTLSGLERGGKLSPETIEQLKSVLGQNVESLSEETKSIKENKKVKKSIKEAIEKAVREMYSKHKKKLDEVFGQDISSVTEAAPEVDLHNAEELLMFIENDGDLHRRNYLPMIKNLATKKARGVYDSELAVKFFMYLADLGAQKYAKEMSADLPWNKQFPKTDRIETAKMLVKKFEQEVSDKAYDYDSMLPKKYQGKEISEEESLQEVLNKKSRKVGKLFFKKMILREGNLGQELGYDESEDDSDPEMSDEEIDAIMNNANAGAMKGEGDSIGEMCGLKKKSLAEGEDESEWCINPKTGKPLYHPYPGRYDSLSDHDLDNLRGRMPDKMPRCSFGDMENQDDVLLEKCHQRNAKRGK